MSRLQGVSTSHFKVNPQTTSSVGPNNLIRFELPSNTLLNFRSIRLLFNATATGTGVSLPNDISSLIERVSVYIGGVLVANGFNGYNTLVHGKAALQGYKCGTLSHPEMIRKINYHSGQTTVASYTADGGGEVITDLSGATVTDSDGIYFYCIDNFEGFLGSIEPSIMDTGLVSTIVIEIALADATVCSVSGNRGLPTLIAANSVVGTGGFDLSGGGTPTYSISNMTMQVEVLSLATNVIDTIVEQRVAQVGYLSIPFKNYFSFSNNHTNTTRFNVNSASWDRLWIVYRDKGYATKAAPVRIKGHKVAGAFVSIAAANDNATNFDIGVPEYDFGGVLNTNAEKYKPFYFNFIEKKSAVTTRSTYQLQINSANVPSYPLTAPEAYAMSMNSLDYYDKNHKISLHQYKMNYFVQCFRFCLPDSDYSRLASGLDCRGVSSSCSLNTVGVDECNVTMFAECTSELRVGAGRQLEVIV
jgi:hypothetical protein